MKTRSVKDKMKIRKIFISFLVILALGFLAVYVLNSDFSKNIFNNNDLLLSQSEEAKLRYLTIEGYSLDPDFDPLVFSYKVTVANSVSTIDLIAEANDSDAALLGVGKQSLEVGANNCVVIVKASSGAENQYTIVVYRETGIDKSKEDYLLSILQLPVEDYDKNEVEGITGRLLGFDIKLLKGLSESEVTIRLINGSITDEPEYLYLKDVVPRGWENTGLSWNDVPGIGGKTTIIKIGHSFSKTFNSHSSIILELHEVSHAIDHIVLDYISESSKFIEIKNEEKHKLFGNDPYFDINEEYFAETLAMFSYNADSQKELKNKAPHTYDFFVDMIENMK